MNRLLLLAGSTIVVAIGGLGFAVIAQSQPVGKALVVLQPTTPGTPQTGHANLTGTVTAGQFVGSGTGLSGVPWAGLSGVPAGFADGIDNDTTYSAGAGLSLTGTQFSVPANGISDSMILGLSWSKVSGAPTAYPPSGAAGGSLTGSYPNPSIANNAVGNAMIADVAWSKVTGAPSSFPPNGAAGGSLTGSYPNPSIANNAVGNAMIADVAWSKVTGAPASYPPNGAAGGDLSGTYPNPTLAANAVGTSDIQNLAITNAKINDVAWSKITGAPALTLTLPYSQSGSVGTPSALFTITNTGTGNGLSGVSAGGYGGYFSTTAGTACFGETNAASGNVTAGYFRNNSTGGTAVGGSCTATSGINIAGSFTSASPSGYALYGIAAANSGTNYGVYALSNSSTSGYAGFFQGRMTATGTKLFTIDHPFDPENKYLMHYCAEGPEPLNVYVGTVRTDAHGYATVTMPSYYEAINRDARIQLTVVDESDSADFVLVKVVKKMKEGQFTIRTNQPRVEVNWEVKAVRNDPWVRTYGAPVEVLKPEQERGTLLNPELYGYPMSRKTGINLIPGMNLHH